MTNQTDSPKSSLSVGVLFGGRSSEHAVSLNSANNVMDALRSAGHSVVPIGISPSGRWLTDGDPHALLSRDAARLETAADNHAGVADEIGDAAANGDAKHQGAAKHQKNAWALLPQADRRTGLPAIDVIFPVLHGPYGEDGTVQGLLEMAQIPYVGCGVLASAVGMDKEIAKRLFAQVGLPQTEYRTLLRTVLKREGTPLLDEIAHTLGFPLFVKPANLGSSVGISRANTADELADAVALAARYDRKIIVEKAVTDAREIEVSVLGNDEPVASVPGEIITQDGFYSYAAKYLDDSSELCIPAALSSAMTQQLQEMAVAAFRAIDGTGLARVDFLLSRETGEIFLNEVNTLPGFTQISMYPKLWEASGISYSELVDRLLRLALARYEERQSFSTGREA